MGLNPLKIKWLDKSQLVELITKSGDSKKFWIEFLQWSQSDANPTHGLQKTANHREKLEAMKQRIIAFTTRFPLEQQTPDAVMLYQYLLQKMNSKVAKMSISIERIRKTPTKTERERRRVERDRELAIERQRTLEILARYEQDMMDRERVNRRPQADLDLRRGKQTATRKQVNDLIQAILDNKVNPIQTSFIPTQQAITRFQELPTYEPPPRRGRRRIREEGDEPLTREESETPQE